MRHAWVLNLDADLELGEGPRYSPSASVRAAMRPHVERSSRVLLAPDDVLVEMIDDAPPPASARGLPGRAFCPTPRALAALRRAGAEPEPHPPVEVLRRVNSRAFAAALGTTLAGAAFVTDRARAEAQLAEPPPLGTAWRVKRAFGMAGRGQRVIAPAVMDARDRAFVRAAIDEGGAQIEPNVTIAQEFGLHGMIAADRSFALGELVAQRCDARGAWLSTERIDDLAPLGDVPDRLLDEGRRVAAALVREGYFGPFGIDAFTYRDGARLRLQPRSEINARYSMGFAIGATPLLRSSAS